MHHEARVFAGGSGFGIVTYRKGGRLGPRRQANHQLVVIHRGEMTVEVDGVAIRVEADSGILLAPGHREKFQFSRNVETRHSWCQLPPEALPEGFRFPAEAYGRAVPCSARTMDLMRVGLRGDGSAAAPEDPRSTTALVLSAMWAFVSGCNQVARTPGADREAVLLAKFQAAVTDWGAREARLEDLARQVGVSRGHLIQSVRRQLGITPMEAFWQARVTRAAHLLKETGLTVAEVAEQTGFANAYHFSRRFRKQYGRPPRAWRLAGGTGG